MNDTAIFLEPIYKDYLWGGDRINKLLNKNSSYEITAESWEVCANSNGISGILNEEYEGKNLLELFNDEDVKEDIFGKKCKNMKEFPILIKFIDAKQNLSIQVHPDDEYAKSIGALCGKNEMWYIMDTLPNAKIISGLKNIDNKDELKYIIENDKIKDYLNYIDVKKGDRVYIPAGTLHAILAGTLICEIQQNVDITYRVYDWDRKGKDGKSRELHKKEAIDVIDFLQKSDKKNCDTDCLIEEIITNEYFTVNKINCNDLYEDKGNPDTFYAYNVIKGNGFIEYNGVRKNIQLGDSFIIPACMGFYKIIGNIELLKTNI